MSSTARLLALMAAARLADRPILVVTPDEATSREVSSELERALAGIVPVCRLPAHDADPYRSLPAHPATSARRVGTLDAMAQEGSAVVLTSAAGLLVPVPCRSVVESWAIELAVGDTLDLETLARRQVDQGYRVVDVVSGPGEFARRGGLFDVWSPQDEQPVRVELFDDEIDSIRHFDVATQRTTGRTQTYRLLPAREAPMSAEQAHRVLDRLMGAAREVLFENKAGGFEGSAHHLQGMLNGIEGIPSFYREDLVALGTWFGDRIIVYQPDEVDHKVADLWADRRRAFEEQEGEDLPPPREVYQRPEEQCAAIERARLHIGDLAVAPPDGRRVVDLGGRPGKTFLGRLNELAEDVREKRDEGRTVVIVARAEGRRARIAEVLVEAGLECRKVTEDADGHPGEGEIVIVPGAVPESVVFGRNGPVIYAEKDLFGADPVAPPKRKRRSEAFLSDLRDLKPGDLVIHIDHGVGRYVGLEQRNRPGQSTVAEEMMLIEYAGTDRLFVPVTRLDLVQKYSGGDIKVVPLDRLGGQGWERKRRKASQAVEEIASELLDLYARRKAVKAHAYGPDNAWQEEFEDSFPHELTPDQRESLAAIKSGLAGTEPMDRLLVGDVGFGKTELALRAAFKVAQEGRQVAVLVPTTVLAFQHEQTFRARVAAWPIRVESVSRLHSPAKNKEILSQVAQGDVDILVGTHRLLSKDVAFKKLGLLIIDEEQRFGVKHKEMIKRLSIGVHVLSMSATPIPRTLQMSLAGVRDLSVIETPPRNRLAIQTHLAAWSPSLIAAAIRNEVGRGGQVYFVHPQVEGIEEMTASLREWVPEARFRHAHGQMPEGMLQETMLGFLRGDFDVLVATTIIENGLDIARANTIIINQAHRFGLSQLYQMRGRVGRSDQRAFAYLVIPSRRSLTPEARRRLSALVEFTELGAGFRIAALDLEIRGAGEFLGARQSGHLAAVGFELYSQMLEHAVRRLRGLPLEDEPEPVTINLGISASLGDGYVPRSGQRLAIYKRLSTAESEQEIDALREETEDRYGRINDSAANLFRLAHLRLLAARQGAIGIDWTGQCIAVRYGERPKVNAEEIVRLMQENPDIQVTPAGIVRMKVIDPNADRIAAATLALRRLAQ